MPPELKGNEMETVPEHGRDEKKTKRRRWRLVFVSFSSWPRLVFVPAASPPFRFVPLAFPFSSDLVPSVSILFN